MSTYLDHLVELPPFKVLFEKDPAYQEFVKLDVSFQKVRRAEYRERGTII